MFTIRLQLVLFYAAVGAQLAPAAISVAVVPTSATLAIAESQPFGATVRNSSNTTVVWKVNGTASGNAIVGTIATAGLMHPGVSGAGRLAAAMIKPMPVAAVSTNSCWLREGPTCEGLTSSDTSS
jgi:hypothetical protein